MDAPRIFGRDDTGSQEFAQIHEQGMPRQTLRPVVYELLGREFGRNPTWVTEIARYLL